PPACCGGRSPRSLRPATGSNARPPGTAATCRTRSRRYPAQPAKVQRTSDRAPVHEQPDAAYHARDRALVLEQPGPHEQERPVVPGRVAAEQGELPGPGIADVHGCVRECEGEPE